MSDIRKAGPHAAAASTIRARRPGIDTRSEAVVLMHRDCEVCRSEGLVAHARVLLRHAGVDLHVAVGEQVFAGQPLCTVHADAPGELAYAFDYAAANRDIIVVSNR